MVKTMQVAEALTNQLDSAELKQQLMMSAIADAVVAVDTTGKVVIFNEAAQSLTGWDTKSAMGIDFNLIFKLKDSHDAELKAETNPFLKAIASGRRFTTNDYYMLNRDNQKIAFSISLAPTYDGRQQVNGAIAVFHDISDQKAVARERNEFISTASHEMRTPVAAIEGYLSMAMNASLATIDERARSFIGKAHDASLHLGKLFRDLLSVTKIEDNRIIINSRIFNMTELVNQISTEMELIARQKNIKLLTHLGGGIGREMVVAPAYEVNADPDRLREVISNLLDNAIKYSKEGTIDVGLVADKRFVTFSVTDMGMGISPEEQKHLFQKFYRVNNSFTREVGGTGLGLYIARSLVERFGGRIWVESTEGKGSTFSFTLPLAQR
ncbi:PAS domain-containing protein [Candidatus Saccharibacteria bacterium]|nr:PAS domain-containing protein [Candidatus Saccharibacteria bacterium]